MKIQTKALAFVLMLTVTMVCTLPSNGRAMLAPTQAASATDRSADMKTIQTVLESKILRERLKGLGLNDKEIESRLGQLSDQQIHKLAKDIDSVNAGGFVVYLLVVIVLVLLVVYLVKRV